MDWDNWSRIQKREWKVPLCGIQWRDTMSHFFELGPDELIGFWGSKVYIHTELCPIPENVIWLPFVFHTQHRQGSSPTQAIGFADIELRVISVAPCDKALSSTVTIASMFTVGACLFTGIIFSFYSFRINSWGWVLLRKVTTLRSVLIFHSNCFWLSFLFNLGFIRLGGFFVCLFLFTNF